LLEKAAEAEREQRKRERERERENIWHAVQMIWWFFLLCIIQSSPDFNRQAALGLPFRSR